MSHAIAQALLAEFSQEAATTRRFLERLPADKLNWRPHAKSMTLGELGMHIALSVQIVAEMARAEVPSFPGADAAVRQPANLAEVLSAHDAGVAFVSQTLPGFDNTSMGQVLRIEANGAELLSLPRAALLRSIMLNHWIHHRGQLSVYLRLLDVALPSAYGPSADELPDFMQAAMAG